MTNKRKAEIEALTIDLLKYYHLYRVNGRGPIFVKEELEKLFNFTFREANLSEGLQGAIFRGVNSVKIVVNQNIDNKGRKNFTYAHEMGHYFLTHELADGKSFCKQSEIESGLNAKNWQEVEANYFGSCFLLPREYTLWNYHYVMEHCLHMPDPTQPLYVDGAHYQNWKSMCSQFSVFCGVSQSALKIRLEELGLLNWNFYPKPKSNTFWSRFSL